MSESVKLGHEACDHLLSFLDCVIRLSVICEEEATGDADVMWADSALAEIMDCRDRCARFARHVACVFEDLDTKSGRFVRTFPVPLRGDGLVLPLSPMIH